MVTITRSAALLSLVVALVTVAGPTAAAAPAAPVLTRIAPASGPSTGNTAIRLVGTALAGARVTVDAAPVAATVAANGRAVTFRAPAHAPGSVPVTVTTAGGTATTAYTYVRVAPRVTDTVPRATSVVELPDGQVEYRFTARERGRVLQSAPHHIDVVRGCRSDMRATVAGLTYFDDEADRGQVSVLGEPVDGQSYASGDRWVYFWETPTRPRWTLTMGVRCLPPGVTLPSGDDDR